MPPTLFLFGKHETGRVAAMDFSPAHSPRLFARYRNTVMSFLVDSGSDGSLVVVNRVNKSKPFLQTFHAANGTKINV